MTRKYRKLACCRWFWGILLSHSWILSSVKLEAKVMKPLLWIQGSDFAPRAINLAVKELISVATRAEGSTLTFLNYLSFCWIPQFVNALDFWWLLTMKVFWSIHYLGHHVCIFFPLDKISELVCFWFLQLMKKSLTVQNKQQNLPFWWT